MINAKLTDALGRTIRDLRISVTDRCNFRCFYCLPHGEPPIASQSKILSYDEIETVCEIFLDLGIEKIRLTGGEPLMRRDLELLVEKLSRHKKIHDLALTTNGYFLPQRAESLKRAGLNRITISLDSLRRETFERMAGADVFDRVMSGIEAAIKAELSPIKINVVVVRGFNENEVVDFAAFARTHDLAVRFIEFMPLDSGHLWSREKVVSGAEIKNRIEERFPLIPVSSARGAQTAARYRFADKSPGEVGFISPVTEPFCGACSRIRLTADGMIRTCLFSTTEHNLRDMMRNHDSPQEITEFITNVVFHKEPHHYINAPGFIQPSRTMSFIGG